MNRCDECAVETLRCLDDTLEAWELQDSRTANLRELSSASGGRKRALGNPSSLSSAIFGACYGSRPGGRICDVERTAAL
jgi:hypothetical protein